MSKEFKFEPGKKYLMKIGCADVDKVEGGIVYGWINPVIRARWDLNGRAIQIPTHLIHQDLICECVEPKAEEPKQELRWVEISERMPEEKDGDKFGHILTLDDSEEVHVGLYNSWSHKTVAWMPTSYLPSYQKKEEELPDMQLWIDKEWYKLDENELRRVEDISCRCAWFAEKGREYERLAAAKDKTKES